MDRETPAQYFLDLIKKARRGKFKVYIGMSAGVGKTYRMLQEAHTLLRNGIDVKIGFVETHGRAETAALLEGLPVVPRKKVFYKGKELEDMDLQAILNLRPEVVMVDELAHTNIPGSRHEKRWQDVMALLDAGISVVSAVNIQHIESLNDEVKQVTGVEVRERVPDRVLREADEVVNIDLTADDLIARLREGKIYPADKVEAALRNFFKPEHILQLRELALKEVAAQVERKVEAEIAKTGLRHERFLACISTNALQARNVIKKTARLASYYNAQWFVVFVETPAESADAIPLDKQRHLINNLKTAAQLGAETVKIQHKEVASAIMAYAKSNDITTICLGMPKGGWLKQFIGGNVFSRLLKKISTIDIDVVVLS